MTQLRYSVKILQVIWLLIAGFSTLALLSSLPFLYSQYQVGCESDCLWGQLPENSLQQLMQGGANIGLIVTILVIALVGERLLELILGGILVWRGTHDWKALLWGFVVITTSMTTKDFQVALPSAVVFLYDLAGFFNIIFFTIAIISFPDGKFKPRWTLPVTVSLYIIIPFALRSISNLPEYLTILLNLIDLSFIILVFAVVAYRYQREFTRLQRQQIKWLLYILALNVVIFLVLYGIVPFLTSELHPIYLLATKFITLWVLISFFVALTISILQYRLWDIDILIHRTLVYGILTGFVVGAYALIVGGLAAIFHSSDQFLFSVTATAIIAILFQPIRERLQHIIDRMLFGERNNPYTVISRLSQRLDTNEVSDNMLQSIAETVAQALKLPYVAIALKYGDDFKTDALYGQPQDQGRIKTLPLTYRQEIVGQMTIGQIAGDKDLDSSAYQLLENIARQVGVVAHAVQLNFALQNSRQQIVTAREEERRRLRRDLHDGLGPALASHTIKIGAARMLIDSDPQTAHHILDELETNLANSLTDIRRLVYNLRPPALDQLGFMPAINDFLQQCNGETRFTLIAPSGIPPLPAAVEVAGYRIVQESVNNVIRHAKAQNCRVEIRHNGVLEITVHDDGIGLPANPDFGVGLRSISERAEELGGTFAISAIPHEGTRVDVRIPL